MTRMTRGAEVRAASYDETDNSVEVIWTTGAAVRRRDWRSGKYYQEILEVTPKAVRLDRLNSGAPFLDTHDDSRVGAIIGSVVSGTARIVNGQGVARIRLSTAPSDADVVSKIKDGIIRNISVGYAIHKVIKTDADGDGNDDEWRVVDWEPLEISAVPVPADAGSQIRSALAADMPVAAMVVRDQIDTLLVDMEMVAALRFGWAAAWLDNAGPATKNADDAFRAMWEECRDFELASMAATAAAAFSIARAHYEAE